MIKYNNSTINDWNFDDANIVKVYHNGAVVYYKVTTSGGTPQYDVCYAVVDDITQYQEREFVDVFDKKTEKWYKLNNLNQYEEYGVYGSGRTSCEGSASRLPQGYTEVEYIENTGTSYINTEVYLYDTTTTSYEIETKISSSWHNSEFEYLIATEGTSSPYNGVELRWSTHYQSGNELQCESVPNNAVYSNIDNGDGTSAVTITCSATQATNNVPLSLFCGIWSSGPWRNGKGKFYTFKVTKNNTLVRNLVPAKRDSDDKYGMYDIVNDVFYLSPNNVDFSGGEPITPTDCVTTYDGKLTIDDGYEYMYSGSSWVNVGEVSGSHAEYPLYYDEKSDPLDNLSFSSMTEANTYAYNNCVYDGMKATIDGDSYEFDSESGWTEVQYYYRVEDVTTSSQGGSGWTVTGSSTNNPNPSYYDDYSTAPNSTSYKFKVAKVTIFGYDSFTYYLRSSGYSGTYVLSTNIDEIQTTPTGMSYSTTSAITNTYNFNKAAGSQVNLSNYRRVTYNNLDKTVEHTFYVVYYNGYIASTSYVNNTNATLLIPKDQSQENWEQVTFSASTNISGSTKSLYIDGNNSSSGGTNYFYDRWIVGLPSGSHSSYTNYSNYSNCPSVSSATFTSVDGGVRQIDYIYVNVSYKTLQFRLVDESGNTITTANTVYYNMNYNNGCGGSSSSSSVSFPRTQTVVNGGRFTFSSSSNRHYIYGYQPNISLYTAYYSDNYSTDFDIPYTKLNTEAVTITYTTYDPNDSETPTFNTVISWPYGNSGTSSTTLASYEVPYTYSYNVGQTSNLFVASAQSYTASSASRAITFTLYPNNREFSTVADLEAYQYAWDGMIANVGDTKYKYEDGVWSEINYTVLDYLVRDSTHKGYIEDIGVVLKDNTKFQIKFNPTNGGGSVLLGQSNATSDNNDYRMFLFSTTLYYDYGSQRINKSIQWDSVYEYEVGNYYIKDLTTSSNVMSSTTQVGVATSMNRIIGLGGNNSDYFIVYYLKVYEGDTLVKNFIPIRNIYGVVTLLDTISGTECTVTNSFKGSDE